MKYQSMPNIKIFKKQKKKLYKNIISVFCPILNETVYFTSEGFNHLLYKRYKTPRKIGEKFMKLMCLNYVVEVVEKCKKISKTRMGSKKIRGKWKKIIYYELVYEIKKDIKIRVIVVKISNGKLKFRSIMPHDKKSKLKSTKNRCF